MAATEVAGWPVLMARKTAVIQALEGRIEYMMFYRPNVRDVDMCAL